MAARLSFCDQSYSYVSMVTFSKKNSAEFQIHCFSSQNSKIIVDFTLLTLIRLGSSKKNLEILKALQLKKV